MNYCRLELNGRAEWGRVEERAGEQWVTALLASPWKQEPMAALGEPILLSETKLLAPVAPTKILCVGRNYRDHAKELGNEVPAEPLLFLKPPSSLLGAGGVVRMPRVAERVDYEGELAVIVGRRIHRRVGDGWRRSHASRSHRRERQSADRRDGAGCREQPGQG